MSDELAKAMGITPFDDGQTMVDKELRYWRAESKVMRRRIKEKDKVLDEVWGHCNDILTDPIIRIHAISDIVRQHSKLGLVET